LVFAEDERQQAHAVLRCEEGGYGIDGQWNDDFHHACRVAATGNAEGYYRDYAGSAQELVSAIRFGYLHQGQWNARQGKVRGTASRKIAAPHFVHFLQNHDQVANSARSLRTHLLTTPGRHRALTALLFVGPQTPVLFMGQEFGARSAFHYFADHESELAALVAKGRREFMSQFGSIVGYEAGCQLPDPADRKTFLASKLNWAEVEQNAPMLELHRDLLRLRREDAVFSRQDKSQIEGSVIGREAFVLRWFDEAGDDRLAIFNLGRDVEPCPPAEPLFAPPANRAWRVLWCSESACYGGSGVAPFDDKCWRIPGHSATLFHAVAEDNG
jgi:maltooligosyltrehalose trehalohydrolase